MGVASNAWRERGNENLFMEPSSVVETPALNWQDATICIVPKFTIDLPVTLWLDACRAVKRHGIRLALDICDSPFGEKPDAVSEFYSQALGMADAVVVNSARMAEKITPHLKNPPTIIADAILGAMSAPAFAPAKRLKLLWFGHPSNLRFLEPWVHKLLKDAPRPCRLVLVTQDGHGAREAAQQIQAHYAPAFETRFVEWSLESTQRELSACDIALLPGVPSDALKGGVSANRIAEILNAGRFPVASPMHSYLEFEHAAWLGNDLIEGIRWAQANRGEVIARIERGQTLVEEKFAMRKLGDLWCELLRGTRHAS